MEMYFQQKPEIQDYCTLLHENNSFCPSIIASMEQNSNKLSQHLSNLLQLKHDNNDDNGGYTDEQNIYMTDRETIEYATQHDLPIFISIDGSLDEQSGASTTITIVAPDIRDYDNRDGTKWQDREAKILLIRSWCLPKK